MTENQKAIFGAILRGIGQDEWFFQGDTRLAGCTRAALSLDALRRKGYLLRRIHPDYANPVITSSIMQALADGVYYQYRLA